AGGTRPVKPTDLQATIASGIVSRTRHLDEWGLSFVQTDASIAGGQSGGPLFDEHGRVLGISGLSFADAFGLALGVEDVIESIERMVDTGGDDYLSLPIDEDGSGERGGFAGLSDGTDVQRLYLGRSDEERQLDFAIADPEDAVVRILSIVHEATLATSSNAEDLYGSQLPLDGTSALEGWRSGPSARRSGPWQQDDEQALPPDDPLPPADDVEVEVEPGRFELQIDRGDIVLIELERPLAEGPTGVL